MNLILSRLLSVIFLFSILSFSTVLAQEEAAGEIFNDCYDPAACNYNNEVIFNSNSEFEAASGLPVSLCIYPTWYIPDVNAGVQGKAIQSCDGQPEGYLLVDQECLTIILENDSYCYLTEWDSICQEALESCISAGVGCGDPDACNYDPEVIPGEIEEYCNYLAWYLPNDYQASTSEPAILSCTPPPNYYYASQCCVQRIVDLDDYCIETDWDGECQGNYEDCLNTSTGCTNPDDCNYDPLACVDDGSCADLFGCTYADACNYNFFATRDDGSCLYPACNDPEAVNWNPFGGCDNYNGGPISLFGGPINISGPCYYSEAGCPGDFDNNGIVSATDLSAFLSAYGSVCEGPFIPLD